ncbi:hypothetical protein L218DRAFT_730504 [Marasmius fiardii PR-910]|nr:hypothetical protein L218DRAFT_730504 [Marasmius fiardii PR-910]
MTEYDYSPEGAARYQQKMDGICRWTYDTGRYRPADPFSPTTPAVQARALQDYSERERDRDYFRTGESGSGQRKNRSRSVGERESRPSHSRSRSYAPAPSQPPVIPGPISQMQQMHGQSTYSFDSSYHGHRSKPQRSTTMPLPPPVPPVPSRTQPVRSHTSHPTQGYNVYYTPQMPRPGESIMIPQGGVYLPPGTTPIHTIACTLTGILHATISETTRSQIMVLENW